MGYIPVPALTAVTSGVLNDYLAVVAGTKTVEMALADMERTANAASSRTGASDGTSDRATCGCCWPWWGS